jgi:hypothetical protein
MKLHTHYVDLVLEFACWGPERLLSTRMMSPLSKIGFARLIQKTGCLLLVAVAAMFFAQGVARAQDQGQAAATGDYYVHVGAGVDSAQCGTKANPCQSIERAIQNATTDSTIHVATGVYTYRGTNNPCNIYLGYSAVACIVNKRVTLYGGYSSDWSQRNPALYPSVIDGGERVQGIVVIDTETNRQSIAGINMDGFTVQNGVMRGASQGNDHATFAFGGGISVIYADVTLRNIRFENNRAIGGSTTQTYGGSAAGGGLSIRRAPSPATLANLVFINNTAESGRGQVRGGYALGGGLFTFLATVNATDLEFSGNRAIAGGTNGSGVTTDGVTADGLGGAAAFQTNSQINLTRVTATGNEAQGGDAATRAGGAYGGAFHIEGEPWNQGQASRVVIRGCVLRDNLVRGGNATSQQSTATGGIVGGGAIATAHGSVETYDCAILHNQAYGGNGVQQGAAGGGGFYLQNLVDGSSYGVMNNSIIADNRVKAGTGRIVGGGGGGVWLQGIRATMTHVTIADNLLESTPLLGSGIVVMSFGVQSGAKPALLEYSVVANNSGEGDTTVLHVTSGNTLNLTRNLFAANEGMLNTYDVGTVNGADTTVTADNALFAGAGAPNYDYRISFASPAVDIAQGSTLTTDYDGDARTGVPDAGAQEAAPFSMIVVPIDDAMLGVFWGENPGVLRYQLSVTCPSGGDAPNELDCGTIRDYGGDTTGTRLTGLTNHQRYIVSVTPVVSGNVRISPTTIGATPTDQFAYVPYARR